MLALRRVTPGTGARILLKLESENPTGSIKDRMALAMIEAAEADGRLKPGGSVVEYTGGSTGVSLSLICAVKGHPLHVVSSDAFSPEKLDHMRILGARLKIVRSESGGMTEKLTRDMVETARGIAAETGGFWTDQLNNTDALAAYHAMAEEIWAQTGGRVDAFVQSVGTAASLRGAGEALRRRNARIRSSPSSPPSRRFSRAARPARTRSTASGPDSSCRSGGRTWPTGSSGSRPTRPRTWPFGSRARKDSSRGPLPERTSSPRFGLPRSSGPMPPSPPSCATRG